MSIAKIPYVQQKAGNSRCPICESQPILLAPEGPEVGPMFYICKVCSFIGQAGVGPVKKISTD